MSSRPFAWGSLGLALVITACGRTPTGPDGGGGGGAGGDGGATGTCRGCVTSSGCEPGGSCVQLGGTDVCLPRCHSSVCEAGATCRTLVTAEGNTLETCVPAGGCGGATCPACPPGRECDQVSGTCVEARDGGACPTFDAPPTASCCRACGAGTPGCQRNGCFGGYLCERGICQCRPPTTPCPTGIDAGVEDGGLTGTVSWDGGTVSRLYFAVVGDTRPALPDDTARYPTAIINQIYDAMEAMSPKPQFVVATGDYVFATPTSSQGALQLDLYLLAKARFSNPLFPSMGNHECTGLTSVNCSGLTANSNILTAYLEKFMRPMGRTQTYYSFDINGPNRQWTSKFVVASCNAWTAAQRTWIEAELARPTTYTFVVRHIPLGVAAPCTAELDPLIRAANVTMVLVGHTHTFAHSGNQLIEGVGGAPISGNATYGYATIEQLASGGMRVIQWDSATRLPVASYVVP